MDKLNISDLVGLEARLSAPVLAKCSLLPSPGLLRDTWPRLVLLRAWLADPPARGVAITRVVAGLR